MQPKTIELKDVLDYQQPTPYIVKSTDYMESGDVPVLTPGKTFILGYTKEKEGIFTGPFPVIIFDDFTTATKLVNFPFKVKSSAMKILLPKSNADVKFIFYFLQTIHFQADTHKRYWISVCAKTKLILPPLAEQKRIVKKIEELFGVIDAQVKRLETAQDALISYRQSILQQAFSGHQIIKKVKDVGNVVTGSTPSTTHPEYYGDEYPFYKPTDLNQGYSTDKAVNYVSQKGFDVSRQLPEKSVLVTCIGATIGKTGLIHQKGICNQQINAIIPSKEYLSEFVYFYAVSPQFQNAIKSNASATTLPILNKKNFEQLPFPALSLSEQKTIVKKIETAFAFADKAQAAITNALEQAKQLKQSILKRAFEGKLVPQDPNDKPVDLTQLKKDKQK